MLQTVLAALAVVSTPVLATGPIHIPLVRHERGLIKRDPYQQTVGGVQIDNDIGLSLPIKLGTPAQDMSVLLSMGSASGLTMFGCNECGETPFYQPNRSSTWSRRENVGGPFDVAYDTIGITGLTVPNASCAYANSTYATKQFGTQTGQAGMLSLGLGLHVNELVGAVVPALSSLWDQLIFGVHLLSAGSSLGSSASVPHTSATPPTNAGQLTFGGLDSTLYKGTVQYVETINSKTWNFRADGLKVDQQQVKLDEYLASQAAAMAQAGAGASPAAERRIVVRPEIGSDQIHVTPAVADALFGSIAGSERQSAPPVESNAAVIEASTGMPAAPAYFYSVPCNTTSNLAISINGTDFNIPPSRWIVANSAGSMCQTRVTVSGQDSFEDELFDILLGTAFLETVYSAFKYNQRQPQIGFAQLADNISASAATSAVNPSPTSAATSSGVTRRVAHWGHVGVTMALLALVI